MSLKHGKILLCFMTVLLLAACGGKETSTTASNESSEEKKLSIYTTLFPIEDFTRKIGGEHVEVFSILPPGSDAHTYEPTTQTMIKIAKADAFIYNGLGMESYAEAIAESVDEDVKMVEASSGIEALEHSEEHEEHEEHNEHEHEEHSEEKHEEHEHDHGDHDPHIWLDPDKAIQMAENIKNTLIELKPDAKEDFEANFQKVKSDLTKLDKEFTSLVDSKDHPEMIVSHAAYGYWENRYGIHQIAISGLSPSNEPSQKALEEIIHTAKEKKLGYVLFEQNVTPKVAKSLQSEIGAKALRLHNLSVLTEEDINKKEDYFSLMRRNLETLDQALK
ncbi:metal ABC transporter solute-binding protein, Zn/Mn family [Guptibacillus hwajinpoensis]|uniref:metal ABC transporter solute-binding protein, Zn/Mn family n=1 Tax=Guptibacillus hwajinpoensis TaxID=208199 RepID=UPI001CFE085C|nr:zinc ABC transporter substrate-binding protein [Pseudalkalibacillus hwajinpoensis]WLR60980.1 zinc ABC transporter substrate-binding protein [Pseudalkalibacillus hwajinpoensis]